MCLEFVHAVERVQFKSTFVVELFFDALHVLADFILLNYLVLAVFILDVQHCLQTRVFVIQLFHLKITANYVTIMIFIIFTILPELFYFYLHAQTHQKNFSIVKLHQKELHFMKHI